MYVYELLFTITVNVFVSRGTVLGLTLDRDISVMLRKKRLMLPCLPLGLFLICNLVQNEGVVESDYYKFR